MNNFKYYFKDNFLIAKYYDNVVYMDKTTRKIYLKKNGVLESLGFRLNHNLSYDEVINNLYWFLKNFKSEKNIIDNNVLEEKNKVYNGWKTFNKEKLFMRF